ncbi:MAG: formylglycine-generating enzyme family protein, partial [Lutibacter sp.]|nr:formylglycine-generating enzyme family protein [Lutibacter sp.]
FNSVMVSGESRKDVDNDSNLFCGSAALGATDLMNYAAFMRYAIRGSLKASYGMKNLGFRCVKDKE